MKRLLFLLALLEFCSFTSVSYAQRVKIPCPTTLNDINDCPDTGCGNVDPHLNRQKNIRSLSGAAEPMTLAQMRKLPDPVKGFKVGNTREKIQALGEGKKIVVVANAIAVRKGSVDPLTQGDGTQARKEMKEFLHTYQFVLNVRFGHVRFGH